MTDRASVREVFLAPVILTCLMTLCAFFTDELAGVDGRQLAFSYVFSATIFGLLPLLLTLFWWVAQLAVVRADSPLVQVRQRLWQRAPYLILPAVIFPLFLAGFTSTKSAIPFLVGYTWDPFWAHADRLIFGDDVWRIAHHWLGDRANRPLEWFYVAAWGSGLLFVTALVALNANERFIGKFYTAIMATWLIGGAGMAYLFSAAGPVFAHLVSSDATVQFGQLRFILDSTLTVHGPIQTGQLLLPKTMYSHIAVKGGGISAMPSMHLATASIYVLAARRTRWLVPAILFWLIIFVASGYFGYHYWVDGIIAAMVATVCWVGASWLFDRTAAGQPVAAHVDDTGAIGVEPLPGVQ